MRHSKALSVLTALVTAILLLTASVAVPILCRPFYYAHIETLQLTETTPWTEDEIRAAYDEMLDFCLGKGEFSTGILAWSEDGKAHFEDVRGLFLLDLYIALAALAVLVFILVLRVFKLRPAPLGGRGPGFWAGAGLAGLIVLVGALAALDFDRAFTVFHAIFFPGKDNWIFDPARDEIIRILPQEFFRNCAVLILALVATGCAVLIISDILARRRAK